MRKFCFSANPLLTRFLMLTLIAVFLTACDGNSAYIDRGYVPVADAGDDQNITIGGLVQLDGSNSINSNGEELSYRWTIKAKPAESIVLLNDVEIYNPSFTPDRVGKYRLELKVSEGELESLPDEIIINVSQQDTPPAQVCTPNVTESKSCAIENGSGIQARVCDNDGLVWGEFENCTVDNCITGYHKDGNLCVVENEAPTVDAGQNIVVQEGGIVTLNATGNDPDGEIVKYEWTLKGVVSGGDQGIVLTQLSLGEYLYTVKVTDDNGLTATDDVKVTITEKESTKLGSLIGKVLDKGGISIARSKVSLPSGLETVSDQQGNYSFKLLAPVERLSVTGSYTGFLQNTEITSIKSGQETVQNIILVRPQIIKNFQPDEGITVNKKGLVVELPPSTYLDQEGTPYDGKLELTASYFPVTTEEGREQFPGDLLAERENGEVGDLTSFGIVKIDLTDEFGNKVIPTKDTKIKLSIPADDSLDKPATIPLWYFDEDKGLWIEDGIATYDPVTNTYVTSVDRIATFNLDRFNGQIGSLEVCVEDSNGNKVSASVFIEAEDQSWRNTSQTSKDGLLRLSSIIVPAKVNLFAGSKDGRLGVFSGNPLLINPGQNNMGQCIVIDNNTFAPDLTISGKVVDSDGKEQPNVNVSLLGSSSGQSFSNRQSYNIVTNKSDDSGKFEYVFPKTSIFAMESYLLSAKDLTVKASKGSAKGQKSFKLKKDTNTYDIGNLLLESNQAPIAYAGVDTTIYPGQAFTLDSSKSYDPDGEIDNYTWSLGDTNISTSSSVSFTPEEFKLKTGRHTFVLTVTDNHGIKATDEVDIIINENIHQPRVCVGLDRFYYQGSNIDIAPEMSFAVSSPIETYQWLLGSEALGNTEHLTNPNLLIGENIIRLTITDEQGLSGSDDVILNIESLKDFIVVNAGLDRFYYKGGTFSIAPETAFSASGPITSYQWLLGGEILSTKRQIENPDFPIGTHALKLIVTDKLGHTASDEIIVTIKNKPTVLSQVFVNAGLDRSYYLGDSISIQAEKVFSAGNQINAYKWTLGDTVLTETALLNNPGLAIGAHTITLTVTDDKGHIGSDDLVITIEKPKAQDTIFVNAGLDRSYYLDDPISIQAEKVFSAGNQINAYKWTLGDTVLTETALLNNPGLAIGAHTITLTVTDDKGHIGSDNLVITIKEKPKTPDTIFVNVGLDRFYYSDDTIRISPEKVYAGDNSITQYQWSKENKEIANTQQLVNPDLPVGTHTLTLTITDDKGRTASDEVVLTIERPKHFIHLNAGVDRFYYVGDRVELVYEKAFSADSQIVSYKWSEGSQEIGTGVWLYKSDFTVGSHAIKLTVTDKEGNTASDELTVTLSEKPNAPDTLFVNAGIDRNFYKGDSINISPEKLFSPGSAIASYKWTLGTQVLSTNRSLNNPDLSVGSHTVKLEITDNKSNTASDELTLTIVEKPEAPNTIFVNAGLDRYYYKGDAIDIYPEKVFSPGRSIKSYQWTLDGDVLGDNRRLYNPDLSVGKHTILLTVTDEQDNTAIDEVVVTIIEKPNSSDAIFVNAGLDRFYYTDQGVSINPEKVFSTNTSIASYQWTLGDKVLSNRSRLYATDLLVGSHTVKFTVTDDQGNKASDELVINIAERPDAPESIYVNIGLDRFYYAGSSINIYPEKVFSTGSSINNYKWTLGDQVLRQSYSSSLSLSGTALPAGFYDIKLTVSDAKGLQASDTFKITILEKPQQAQELNADAGIDRSLYTGKEVRLSANNSYSPSSPLTYEWHEGSLLLSAGSFFDYKPDTAGKHVITLTIKDDVGNTDTDEINIHVVERNYGVFADASLDRSMYKGNSAYLGSTNSYSLAGSLSYEWHEGDKLLSTSSAFSYKPETLGDHLITLRVKDEAGNTDSDELTVSVIDYQSKGVFARAGVDKAVYLNGYAYFDGRNSYTLGRVLNYEWHKGDTLLSTRQYFSYLPKELGEHVITLTVKDDAGNSDTDAVSVFVVNKPDTSGVFADAGLDQTVYVKNNVNLRSKNDYSLSPNLSFEWRAGDKLLSRGYYFYYYPQEAGVSTITLTVTDNAGNTDTDEIVITAVERPNITGVFADAGLDQTVYVNRNVYLRSRNDYSLSPNLSYEWREGDKLLSRSSGYRYYLREAGEHTITLTVTDDAGNTATDEVKVTAIDRVYSVHADAGSDQSVYQGNTLLIQASNNNYSSAGNVNYEWYEGDKLLSTGTSFYYQPKTLGDHSITFKIKDSVGNSGTDELVVKVIEPRSYGIYADAGADQSIYLGSSLTIGQANTSYSLFGALSYEWREGTKILNNNASFVYKPQTAGDHTISLTVVDDAGNTATDDVVVHAAEKVQDHKVYADAGQNLSTYLGDTVTVGATNSSFSLTGALKYEWKEGDKILGTGSSLNYQPESLGKHTISLTVSNEAETLTDIDEVTVQVVEKPHKVLANAGLNKEAYLGEIVALKGDDSFTLSGTPIYEWKEGDNILSTDSSLNYQPASLGKHTITLMVSNEAGTLTDTDEVIVQVAERPHKVLANAGLSQGVYLGETATFSGAKSFSLSGILTYEWREGAKVLGTNADLAYVAEKPGKHLLTLTVTDDAGNKESDEIALHVVESACDVELIAYAGLNKTIVVNEKLTITGVAYDPRGIKTYQWLDKDNNVLSNDAELAYETAVTGQHTLTFIVTNKEGESSSDTVVITVINRDLDVVSPVITLNGEETVRITQGDVYIDAGASAIDDQDGILTTSIVTTRPFFNTYRTGTYTVTYSVQDKAGNSAKASRTVIIMLATSADTTPPVITLIGANAITVPYRSVYNDLGATVIDNRDGVLGYGFNSDVNTSIPGEYDFIYTARDTAGNTSTKTRKVIVSPDPNATDDTTPPLIRLNGNAVITILKDSIYKDLGATVVDNVDGEITDQLIIDNPVNTATIGNYRVIYTATDNAGNEARKSRLVKVRREETGPDTTPPVITIKGDNPFSIVLGETFNDPGATALDDRDGSLGVGFRSNVNPNAVGRYTIIYLARDEAGNEATLTRIVKVTKKPVEPGTLPAILVKSLEWLEAQKQADGSYTNNAKISMPWQSTAEVLRAYHKVGETSAAGIAPAKAYLSIEDSKKVEALARKIIIGSESGDDVSAMVSELTQLQNVDSGFGDQAHYHSRVTDTAFALKALGMVGNTDNSVIGFAINYLKRQQSIEGGFSHSSKNQDSIYETALSLIALQEFQHIYSLESEISLATTYLLDNQSNNDTTNWEAAYALLAIKPTTANKVAYKAATDSLKAAQLSNGSWNNEVYTTALAIRAIYKAENALKNL